MNVLLLKVVFECLAPARATSLMLLLVLMLLAVEAATTRLPSHQETGVCFPHRSVRWFVTHSPDSDGPVTMASTADFSRLTTGWPSPAAPFAESLNLQRWLIQHPSATYLLRVAGDTMTPRIHQGDVVVVDRSLPARNNDVVVVIIGPEFTLKRYQRQGLSVLLTHDNPAYAPIEVTEASDAVLWGVVTHIIAQPRVR